MANNDNPSVAQLVQTVNRLMQHGVEQMEQHDQIQLQLEQMMDTLMNLLAANNDNPNADQLVQTIEQLLQQRIELMKQHEQIQYQLVQMMLTLLNLLVVNSIRQKEVPQIESPVADDIWVYSKDFPTDCGMAEPGAASLMQSDEFMKDHVSIQVLASDAETNGDSLECSTSKSSDAEANRSSSECSASESEQNGRQ